MNTRLPDFSSEGEKGRRKLLGFFWSAYAFVCIWLLLGLINAGLFQAQLALLFHFSLFSMVCWKIRQLNFERFNFSDFASRRFELPWFGLAMIYFLVIIAVAHWGFIGRVPIIDAMSMTDTFHAVLVRQRVVEDSGASLNYFYAILSGGVLPFLCLFLYVVKDKRAYYFYFLSIVYVSSFLQKAPPVFIALPLLVYLLIENNKKKALRFLLAPIFSFLIIQMSLNGYVPSAIRSITDTGMSLLEGWSETSGENSFLKTVSQNSRSFLNERRENLEREYSKGASLTEVPKNEPSNLNSVFWGNVANIADRLFLVPGRTGAVWVSLIPFEIPYGYGCGYRPLSLLMGCDFINFPVLIHQHVERELVSKGIRGTMNAAEVFNAYANFGLVGSALSGVFIALFFAILAVAYKQAVSFGIAVSSPFIFMQSSVALPVTLLSGGWLASLFLFLLFRRFVVANNDAR